MKLVQQIRFAARLAPQIPWAHTVVWLEKIKTSKWQFLNAINYPTACGTIGDDFSKLKGFQSNQMNSNAPFHNMVCQRAGIKPAPTGEHGAFCNSPVGATLVVALPPNKNFNSFQKNGMGCFSNVAQLVRQNRKPINNVSLNQMVATLLAERSAKARA
jgi:hypothetical protein